MDPNKRRSSEFELISPISQKAVTENINMQCNIAINPNTQRRLMKLKPLEQIPKYTASYPVPVKYSLLINN